MKSLGLNCRERQRGCGHEQKLNTFPPTRQICFSSPDDMSCIFCTFPNKALLRVGRQERAWQFSETITKEGSVESHEHSQSLGMFQSIPGTRHGRLHAHQHQDRSGANERHSSRALEGSDVCWQAEQQRGAS